jgi:prevent-host-death family protein
MKKLELAKATAPLAEYAQEARKGPLILTSGGRPVAALLPVDNADSETVTLSTNPKFIALIERSRMRQKVEGGLSSKEMRRRLALKRARRRR